MRKKREPIFKFWTKWGDFILSWKWALNGGLVTILFPRLVGCFDDLCRFSDLSAISRLGISEIVARDRTSCSASQELHHRCSIFSRIFGICMQPPPPFHPTTLMHLTCRPTDPHKLQNEMSYIFYDRRQTNITIWMSATKLGLLPQVSSWCYN